MPIGTVGGGLGRRFRRYIGKRGGGSLECRCRRGGVL